MASPLSNLDVKKMEVVDLRKELAARGLDNTGLKGDLSSRFEAVLASELAASDAKPVTAPSGSVEPVKPSAEVEIGELKSSVPDVVTPTTSKADATALPEPSGLPAANGDAKTSATETALVDDKVKDVPAGDDRNEAVNGEKEIAERSSTLEELGQSELEKKKRRAERFGLPVCVSEEEKMKARAEKFGPMDSQVNEETLAAGAAPLKVVSDVSEPASEAAKKVAIAFTEAYSVEAEKKAARAERFGSPVIVGGDTSKKAARAERFGTSIDAETDTSNKAARSERPYCSPAEQEKMRRRAERFGLPLKLESEVDAKEALPAENFATPLTIFISKTCGTPGLGGRGFIG